MAMVLQVVVVFFFCAAAEAQAWHTINIAMFWFM